jgi:hypothetical protein
VFNQVKFRQRDFFAYLQEIFQNKRVGKKSDSSGGEVLRLLLTGNCSCLICGEEKLPWSSHSGRVGRGNVDEVGVEDKEEGVRRF